MQLNIKKVNFFVINKTFFALDIRLFYSFILFNAFLGQFRENHYNDAYKIKLYH